MARLSATIFKGLTVRRVSGGKRRKAPAAGSFSSMLAKLNGASDRLARSRRRR